MRVGRSNATLRPVPPAASSCRYRSLVSSGVPNPAARASSGASVAAGAAYRVTDTEIHAACGGFKPMPDGEGQTLIVENDRVRVTRLMIGAGESIPLHPSCGMLVAVTEGQIRLRTGGPEESLAMAPADFKWRDSFRPMLLVNVGRTVFHAVDIVVK